ncbi:MAG: TolC family protein, partial [Pseudomonadota bacterium]
AVTQTIQPSINEALTLSSNKLKTLKEIRKKGDLSYDQITTLQNNIFSKRDELYELNRQGELAEIEFKALLSISPKTNIKLNLSEDLLNGESLPATKSDIDRYVATSLEKRPEIREELLNLRISERNVKTSLLETLPGISFLFAANQDDNSFLEDREWLSLTASISQSITRLLTLPARYTRAKEEVNLANERRRALVAAVVSQVYIAQALYAQSKLNLDEADDIYEVAKDKFKRSQAMKENGLMGGLDLVDARLEYEVQRKKYYDQVLDLHANYARFMNVVGYDFVDVLNINAPALAYKEGILYE